MVGGSSPLARGLPGGQVGGGFSDGIIPARAGFTAGASASALPARDHPRSRGVYKYRTLRSTRPGGSSPLARGLPRSGGRRPGRHRIIPARAGFTCGPGLIAGVRGDHPRSRGVYGVEGEHVVASLWIIPARAGFTLEAPHNLVA